MNDEILQIDLKFEDMFSFSCTVENQMGKPLNLRLSIRQTTVVDPILNTDDVKKSNKLTDKVLKVRCNAFFLLLWLLVNTHWL